MAQTDFEKEFGVDLSSANLEVVKAIEIALKVEKRGKGFYSSNATRKENLLVRPFLEFLSGEEDKHIAMLSELTSSLKKSGKWTKPYDYTREVKQMLFDLEVFRGKKARGQIKESCSLSVILRGMEMEKGLVDYYSKLSANLKDKEGKAFFKALSGWEESHFKLLKGIHEMSDDFRMQT